MKSTDEILKKKEREKEEIERRFQLYFGKSSFQYPNDYCVQDFQYGLANFLVPFFLNEVEAKKDEKKNNNRWRVAEEEEEGDNNETLLWLLECFKSLCTIPFSYNIFKPFIKSFNIKRADFSFIYVFVFCK